MAMYDIKQVPSENHTSRDNHVPFVIVNHITAGSLSSVDNWFTSKNNDKASAHFTVGRNGEIHQYVDIRKRAWHAGLTKEAVQFATAPVVLKQKINPNAYTVGIEHEGYEGNGIDGTLTEEQFWATVWLHRYIKEQVFKLFNRRMELNEENVIGHFQVDPRRKPNCPGVNFPWKRLYEELYQVNMLSLEATEKRIDYIKNRDNDRKMADMLVERMTELRDRYVEGKYREAAKIKIRRIEELLAKENLL